MKVSMTGASIVVFFLMMVLKKYGIQADENSLTAFVENIISVASFITMIVGQFRRTDVKGFVLKNENSK
jgi:leucyl aminopeptidase